MTEAVCAVRKVIQAAISEKYAEIGNLESYLRDLVRERHCADCIQARALPEKEEADG